MAEIQHYKALLESALTELTDELKTVGIHDPNNPSDWVAVPEATDGNESDTDLIADVVEAWDERQGLVATLEARYNNLTRALKKIEGGTYGTCEICGSAIEDDRLMASPEARTDKAHMNDERTLPL